MEIPRPKRYVVTPKMDISLDTKKGGCHQFKVGEKYLAQVFILDIAHIIIDRVKVTVNASWLVDNFNFRTEEDEPSG